MKIRIGIGVERIRASGIDAAAAAFIAATGITDPTIIEAVNFRVRSFKGLDTSYNASALNLWDDIFTDHPFVGGAATPHRYNLKNPATKLITWAGGVTHDANGVTGNGSNAYGDAGIKASELGQNTVGYALYSRLNAAVTNEVAFGASELINNTYILLRTANVLYFSHNSLAEESIANTDSSGCFLVTRTSGLNVNVFIRGTKTSKTLASISPSTLPLFILAINNNGGGAGNYSTSNLASLTTFLASQSDAKAAAYKDIDQQFQTMLGRQI